MLALAFRRVADDVVASNDTLEYLHYREVMRTGVQYFG
jgi:hypothetical protein